MNRIAALAIASSLAFAPAAFAQQPTPMPDRGYVGQMTEEQIKQKLYGEGFSSVSDLKKVPVTRYRWEGKATRGGKEMQVTIDERGHVSAK
jgi:Peptidase propeptide and YPEB domain